MVVAAVARELVLARGKGRQSRRDALAGRAVGRVLPSAQRRGGAARKRWADTGGDSPSPRPPVGWRGRNKGRPPSRRKRSPGPANAASRRRIRRPRSTSRGPDWRRSATRLRARARRWSGRSPTASLAGAPGRGTVWKVQTSFPVRMSKARTCPLGPRPSFEPITRAPVITKSR